MKKLPWFDRQSRTGERPEPSSAAPSKRSRTSKHDFDFELKMWNIPEIQAAAPEMYDVLERNLKDMDMIDRVCDSSGFPRFEIMRKEIEAVLEKARRS